MTKDNDTVEQKFSEIRNYLEDEGIPTDKYKDLHRLVDEIEAAHKRELAAKDAEIAKRNAFIKKASDALCKASYGYPIKTKCHDLYLEAWKFLK